MYWARKRCLRFLTLLGPRWLRLLPAEQRPLSDQVNRLRDRLDDLLFGCQDFGMVGRKGQ